MDGPVHQTIETNGIRLRVAIQGDGPLVLLCHGFPETSHSWRHQLKALAAAGYTTSSRSTLRASAIFFMADTLPSFLPLSISEM